MARRSIDELGALQKAVMETIWALGEATVGQVRDRLDREPPPAYTTILSVMQKLEKAGWLTHRPEGRSYVYLPTRSRDEAGTSTLRTFIDRVFRGDTAAHVPAPAGGRGAERPGPLGAQADDRQEAAEGGASCVIESGGPVVFSWPAAPT